MSFCHWLNLGFFSNLQYLYGPDNIILKFGKTKLSKSLQNNIKIAISLILDNFYENRDYLLFQIYSTSYKPNTHYKLVNIPVLYDIKELHLFLALSAAHHTAQIIFSFLPSVSHDVLSYIYNRILIFLSKIRSIRKPRIRHVQ